MSVREIPLLVFDGACGTGIQSMDLPDRVWQGKEGCNELLNVTAPEAITGLHAGFLEAGATVVETNTFGAARIVLAEYGLEDRVAEINAAAVANARRAIGGRAGRYVAGSIGPGTKLPSLGHVSRDVLFASLREQVAALAAAGVDLFLLETCQDLLQVKTALIACMEVVEETHRDIPILVSVTIERTGTMLLGSDIAAVVATLEPFPILSLGLNCATGPADMTSHIRYLSRNWPGRISCIPNAGLPEVIEGRTVYPLGPRDFARQMAGFVRDYGVSIVGGCCGTTPEHIRELVAALAGVTPVRPAAEEEPPSVAGGDGV